MDIVLGVSMGPETVRLVLIEGQDADGVTVEQDEFGVAADSDSANSGAVDQVIAAIRGTREGAGEGGYQLVSTGVTWTDPAEVGALRDALTTQEAGGVMLVAPLLAAAALAQTVGQAIGYEHIAMLFVEPQSATLAVIEVSDGSIVDLHRHQLVHADDATSPAASSAGSAHEVAAELATMLAGLDGPGSRADGVFLVGSGTDIVPLKPALEAATSLLVTAPEEPEMALARGAALASANAPLFASSTAALAYALDPGTGELNPRAFSPSYLDVSGNAFPGALAYSALGDEADDEYDRTRRGGRRFVLAGGALGVAAAVVAGVLAMSLTSDRPTSAVQHNPRVSIATPGRQAPAQAPSPPPQAQLPAPSPPPPPPTAQAAAPPARQAAPPPTVAAPPAAPVYRAPVRRAPEYVPTPVPEAAPAPRPAPPAAPPPPPPPAAPALPPMTMYLHLPFVTVPIPINPPPPPPPPAP